MQAREINTTPEKPKYYVTQQYKLHRCRKPTHGKQRLIDLCKALMPDL
jgi:hypothetical protein